MSPQEFWRLVKLRTPGESMVGGMQRSTFDSLVGLLHDGETP
jgi:hypothetical protein